MHHECQPRRRTITGRAGPPTRQHRETHRAAGALEGSHQELYSWVCKCGASPFFALGVLFFRGLIGHVRESARRHDFFSIKHIVTRPTAAVIRRCQSDRHTTLVWDTHVVDCRHTVLGRTCVQGADTVSSIAQAQFPIRLYTVCPGFVESPWSPARAWFFVRPMSTA